MNLKEGIDESRASRAGRRVPMSRLEMAMVAHHANSDRYHAAAAAFHQSLVDHGSGSPQWTAAKEAYAKSCEALRASFDVVMGLQGSDEEARVRHEEETTMDAACVSFLETVSAFTDSYANQVYDDGEKVRGSAHGLTYNLDRYDDVDGGTVHAQDTDESA
jgi:hypothetical protein